MTRQRLILLFDGTWNDPESETNVCRLRNLIEPQGTDGVPQQVHYHPGVGTKWSERLRGGAFGYGLTPHLLHGYERLVGSYRPGDEIWVFGFSRGAYMARSLVGLIRKCGVLRQTEATPERLKEAEGLYRNKNFHPNSERCQYFRLAYSHEARVRFIGVWDTVGALGIPGTSLSEHGKYAWHDTELSKIVDYAYHAMALDEHRGAYDATLWTNEGGDQKPENKEIEQRWFIGAHANVGGGYGPADLLPDLALQWMLGKAHAQGLGTQPFQPRADAWRMQPRDSYAEFMGGWYSKWKAIKFWDRGRYCRHYDKGGPQHDVDAVKVTVDDSVWQRWRDDALDYRPQPLVKAKITPP